MTDGLKQTDAIIPSSELVGCVSMSNLSVCLGFIALTHPTFRIFFHREFTTSGISAIALSGSLRGATAREAMSYTSQNAIAQLKNIPISARTEYSTSYKMIE